MKTYTAIIEKDTETGFYLGYVHGVAGAHSQGETWDELHKNLKEFSEYATYARGSTYPNAIAHSPHYRTHPV